MKTGETFDYKGALKTPGLFNPDDTRVPVDFSGKVGLLLFTDNSIGDSWQGRLDSIWSEMETFLINENIASDDADVKNHFRLTAVVTNHGGSSSIPISADYDVLLDADGLGDLYRAEFLNATDDSFPLNALAGVGSSLWGFIIDSNDTLADKWHDLGNTQTAGADTPSDPTDDVFSNEPISFHHLSPAGYTGFDSADYDNVKAYVLERLKNLFRDPYVISADPAIGSANITVADLSTVRIRFSRPLLPAELKDSGNYSTGGGGGTGLQINSADYNNSGLSSVDQINVGEIENEVTLGITRPAGPPLDAGTVRIDLDTAALLTHDTKGITPNIDTKYAVTFNGPEIVHSGIVPPGSSPLNTHTSNMYGNLEFKVPFTDEVFSQPVSSPTVPVTGALTTDDVSETVSGGITGFVSAAAAPAASGEAAAPNKQYTVTLNSAGWGGTGTLQFTLGTNSNAVITNRFGNELRGVKNFSYTLDLDPPEASILYPLNGAVVNNVTVRVSVTGAAEKRLIINGQSTVLGGDSINLYGVTGYGSVADGTTFTLILEAVDANGNKKTDSIELTKNTLTAEDQQPYHIVYVVDKSGSMNSNATYGNPSVTKHKAVWVREALDAVVPDLIAEFGTPGDRYGVVLYSKNAITALALTPKQDLAVNQNIFSDALDENPLSSTTAMGAGLSRALDLLSYTVPNNNYFGRRAIVFFADGQQNVPPYVTFNSTDNPDSLSVETAGTGSGCPSNMGTINIPGGADIPVHTMGIGFQGDWLTTLENISSVSGGSEYCSVQIWPEISASLNSILPDLFPSSSPQIVRNESEHLGSNGRGEILFPLNTTVSKIAFYLEWPGGKSLDLTLKKGNTRISFDRIIRKERSVICIVEFPHYQLKTWSEGDLTYTDERAESPLSRVIRKSKPRFRNNGRFVDPSDIASAFKYSVLPRGDWSVSVFSPEDGAAAAGRSYLLTVIADEKDYYYQLQLGGLPVFAGNPFDISILLARKKELPPVDPDIQIKVKSPAEALTNIISGYKPLHAPVIPGDAVSGGTGKMNAKVEKLLSEPGLLKGLKLKESFSLSLKQTKANLMSGVVTGLTTQGYHKARVIIRHEDKKNGVYERVVDRPVKINVRPDYDHSDIKIIKDGKYYNINVRPADQYGNLLGPGFGGSFPKYFLGYRIINVNDRLDGSYTLKASRFVKDIEKPDAEKIFRLLFS